MHMHMQSFATGETQSFLPSSQGTSPIGQSDIQPPLLRGGLAPHVEYGFGLGPGSLSADPHPALLLFQLYA